MITKKIISTQSIKPVEVLLKILIDKKAWELIKKTGCDKFVVGEVYFRQTLQFFCEQW